MTSQAESSSNSSAPRAPVALAAVAFAGGIWLSGHLDRPPQSQGGRSRCPESQMPPANATAARATGARGADELDDDSACEVICACGRTVYRKKGKVILATDSAQDLALGMPAEVLSRVAYVARCTNIPEKYWRGRRATTPHRITQRIASRRPLRSITK